MSKAKARDTEDGFDFDAELHSVEEAIEKAYEPLRAKLLGEQEELRRRLKKIAKQLKTIERKTGKKAAISQRHRRTKDEIKKAEANEKVQAENVLAFVRSHPGCSNETIIDECGKLPMSAGALVKKYTGKALKSNGRKKPKWEVA